MSTGKRIQRLRKESNYTQENLAEILNVSRQSVSKWELDVSFPETEKLIQLAKLFDSSIDYLLLGKDVNIKRSKSFEFTFNKNVIPLLIYMSIYLITIFIMYSFEFMRVWIELPFPSSGYEIIELTGYQIMKDLSGIGNIAYFSAFILVIVQFVIILVKTFINDNIKWLNISNLILVILGFLILLTIRIYYKFYVLKGFKIVVIITFIHLMIMFIFQIFKSKKKISNYY